MTFLVLLLRLAVIYFLVRLIWKALTGPRRPSRAESRATPAPTPDPKPPLGDDIVDAEWEDLEE